MIRIGLASSAFPARSPREIMQLALEAGLDGVEWAAGFHLAPGDKGAAQTLMMETLMSRLSIVSYAALYRVSANGENGLGFASILDTASTLQAPILRIFVGQKPLARTVDEEKVRLLEELARLGDLAGERGITLCLSFGKGTSLEEYGAARRLLAKLDHSFVRLAWEPLPGVKLEDASAAIAEFSPRTSLVLARRTDRLGRSSALSAEAEAWKGWIEAFRLGETEPKMSRFILLGGIGDGDEARLHEDAVFLRGVSAPPARR
jgi:hypothetical protein